MDTKFRKIVDAFFETMKKEYSNKKYLEDDKTNVLQRITSDINAFKLGFSLEDEEAYIDEKVGDLIGDIIFESSGIERI